VSSDYFAAVGIDPSLTATGVALVQNYDDERVRSVHTFGRKGKKDETLAQRERRILDVVNQVCDTILSLDITPIIAIEGPAHGQTTGSHHDRSGLWWILVHEVGIRTGAEIVEITPTQVKKYATGKGNAGKAEVMAAAIRRYLDVPISNDNEADAWILAAMAARLINEPIEESLPKANLDAMTKVVRSP